MIYLWWCKLNRFKLFEQADENPDDAPTEKKIEEEEESKEEVEVEEIDTDWMQRVNDWL